MISALRFGTNSSVRLELPDRVRLAECGTPTEPALEDPAAATTDALARPLECPSLDRCMITGDRVVLTLDRGVPRAAEITAAVVRALVAGGVDPDGIAVLRTRLDAQAGVGDPRAWLSDQVRERITLVTHDSTDRDQLAYLAAFESGEPILLNRAITDADMVLPIGCFHRQAVAGYYGIHSPVFPTFADHRTQVRFRSPASLGTRGRHKKKVVGAVDEVGWLLGVMFTIQVIPGPGGDVLHVVAGKVDSVRRRSRRLYEAAWRWSVPHRASLVVAAIEGSADQQTWQNLGRALTAAAEVVEDDGAIALCCDLADEPGPAIERLSTARSREETLAQIRKEQPEDILPALQLARVQERVKVYLLSRLDPVLVEGLEIAPLALTDELVRLAGRHESCIVMGNAHRTMVTIEEDG